DDQHAQPRRRGRTGYGHREERPAGQGLGDRLRNLPRNHRTLGDGSHRSGSHSTNADQPAPSRTPPTTSLGQWSPAHTLAMQARTMTTIAASHSTGRRSGLNRGASDAASMKLNQVKKTA